MMSFAEPDPDDDERPVRRRMEAGLDIVPEHDALPARRVLDFLSQWKFAVDTSFIGTYIWSQGFKESEFDISRFVFCDFYEISHTDNVQIGVHNAVSTVILRDIGLDCRDEPQRKGRCDVSATFISQLPIRDRLYKACVYETDTDGRADGSITVLLLDGNGVRFEGLEAAKLRAAFDDYDLRHFVTPPGGYVREDALDLPDGWIQYPSHLRQMFSAPSERRRFLDLNPPPLTAASALWLPYMYREVVRSGAVDDLLKAETVRSAYRHLVKLALMPNADLVPEVVEALLQLYVDLAGNGVHAIVRFINQKDNVINEVFIDLIRQYTRVELKQPRRLREVRPPGPPVVGAPDWHVGSVVSKIRAASNSRSVVGSYLPDNMGLRPGELSEQADGNFVVMCLEPLAPGATHVRHMKVVFDTRGKAPLRYGRTDGRFYVWVDPFESKATLIDGVIAHDETIAKACIGIRDSHAYLFDTEALIALQRLLGVNRIVSSTTRAPHVLPTVYAEYGIAFFMLKNGFTLPFWDEQNDEGEESPVVDRWGERVVAPRLCTRMLEFGFYDHVSRLSGHSRTLVDIYFYDVFAYNSTHFGDKWCDSCELLTDLFNCFIMRERIASDPSNYADRASIYLFLIKEAQKSIIEQHPENPSIPILFRAKVGAGGRVLDNYSAPRMNADRHKLASLALEYGLVMFGQDTAFSDDGPTDLRPNTIIASGSMLEAVRGEQSRVRRAGRSRGRRRR